MDCEKEQELTPTQRESVKRTMAVVIIIGLMATFCMLVHVEWIHPYPTQYRIVTNGSMYKIQEKNWFIPWMYYKEDAGWDNEKVFSTRMLSRAKGKLVWLERREKDRMTVKEVKIKANPWKPIE